MGAPGSRCLEYDPDSNGRACETTCCREASGVVNRNEPPSELISACDPALGNVDVDGGMSVGQQ
jgi:hypothetical protein